MLKADLIRPRIKVGRHKVSVRTLPSDYHWLGVAQDLIQLCASAVGQSRGHWQALLREYEGDSLDYPIIRGLADVLTQRAHFASMPPLDPVALRTRLFSQGVVTSKTTLFQPKNRQAIIREAATHYGLTEKQVETALFADLLEEQILQDVGEPITPRELIDRYNLEIARGVLYWAREVNLHVEDGYQTVFKYIKLFGLMHTIMPASSTGYDIQLHGPLSPFVKSTIRYGLQFARFMPALLLCRQWQMDAQVRLPYMDKFLSYPLDHHTHLQGYFKDKAGFDSQLEAGFAAEFEAKYTRTDRLWELAYEDEVIPMGDSVMIPDFSFTHKKDGRRALLEIVGFWHPDYLRRKLAKIRQAQKQNLIILVYEQANVAEEDFKVASAGEVLMFKRKPVLKDVLAAVERCAV